MKKPSNPSSSKTSEKKTSSNKSKLKKTKKTKKPQSPSVNKESNVLSSTSNSKHTKVEFRFLCSADLREQMNKRLKTLNLERSQIMVGFIQEWLKQTDEFLEKKQKTIITTKKLIK